MIEQATVAKAEITGDRRGASRRRVLLAGKLVQGSGAYSTDCAIRELTDAGARLRLAGPVALGDEVYLIELRSGVAHQVRVAWKRDAELGVTFERTIPLNASTGEPGADVRMRRLWRDAARC